MPVGRLVFAIFTTTAMMALLLAFAALSKAESTDVIAAVSSSVVESPNSASTESAPPSATEEPEPTAAPEPVESVAVESAPSTDSSPTPSPPRSPTVSAEAVSTESSDRGLVQVPDAAASSIRQVSDQVGRIDQVATGTVAQAVDPKESNDRPISALLHHPLNVVSKTLQRVSRDLSAPSIKNLLPPALLLPAAAPSEADVGAFSPPVLSTLLSAPPPTAYPRQLAAVLDSSLVRYLPEPGSIAPLRLVALSVTSGPTTALPKRSAEAAISAAAGTGVLTENLGPLGGKAPAPAPGSSSQATASGLGSSAFVPIVALLALLALAALATLRRLREDPDFRAPTPFVCALERPG
jgi:hypothetical protein